MAQGGRGVRATLTKLQESLTEAGLGGQVRIGVSAPTPLPAERRAPPASPAPDSARPQPTEEVVFPLDDLLRPLERPARGQLVELSGARSSGRTGLAYRLAAGATARGELVGWVDLPDTLDPRFLRRSGVALDSLLWVRPPHARAALRAAELLVKTGFALVVLDLDSELARDPGLARSVQALGTATWTRLLRAAHGRRATVAVLGPERVAGSFATLGLAAERDDALFCDGLFEGLAARARVVRNRSGPTDQSRAFRVLHRP